MINRGMILHGLCSIYAIAAVDIYILRYLWRMLRTLLVLSRQHFDSHHKTSLLCILPLDVIYDWITIMGYIVHELSTINVPVVHPKSNFSNYTPTSP